VKIPERMAMHADPLKKMSFSRWNVGQCEWPPRAFRR
jgi:hypothetical protein